jgi:hypothetical protein
MVYTEHTRHFKARHRLQCLQDTVFSYRHLFFFVKNMKIDKARYSVAHESYLQFICKANVQSVYYTSVRLRVAGCRWKEDVMNELCLRNHLNETLQGARNEQDNRHPQLPFLRVEITSLPCTASRTFGHVGNPFHRCGGVRHESR